LFPKNPTVTRDLSIYYSTASGVYGTIFALVVTLSGQIPKNIFSIPAHFDPTPDHKKARCSPGARLPPGEHLLYPRRLRYFVALYGTSLGLSLLGLILGTNIRFDTLITGSLQENAILLIQVALFETTFLLIPPTIISMYHLMQVASFRGKVTIKSEPQGAKVCLSRCHHPQESSSTGRFEQSLAKLKQYMAKFFPILKPEPTKDKKDMYDLGLTTPCTLMLTKGEYKICLSRKDYRLDEPATITSADGIEKEYTFNLTPILTPIKSKKEGKTSTGKKDN
ncbi:MAG: hypothetical protein WBN94_09285, partial [Methanothrix sp.]